MDNIILKSIGGSPFIFCDLKLSNITPPTYNPFQDLLFKGLLRMESLPAAPAVNLAAQLAPLTPSPLWPPPCYMLSADVHCNKNPIYVFLFWELRGLSPSLYIHESMSDLYIPIFHIFPAAELADRS
jgi:hypothetical protein